jgi:hypothetical protein
MTKEDGRMKKWICFMAVFALAVSAYPALAAEESYELKEGAIYRVSGGKRQAVEDVGASEEVSGGKGYYWFAVSGELSEGMKGSKNGVWFFDGAERPLGFVPFDDADICGGAWLSPDFSQVVIDSGTGPLRIFTLYDFKTKKVKKTFNGSDPLAWIDNTRFAFTFTDTEKDLRPTQEVDISWDSVAIYETTEGMEGPTIVKEATKTKNYTFMSADPDEQKLVINETSVKNESDWGNEDKTESNEITVDYPPAG